MPHINGLQSSSTHAPLAGNMGQQKTSVVNNKIPPPIQRFNHSPAPVSPAVNKPAAKPSLVVQKTPFSQAELIDAELNSTLQSLAQNISEGMCIALSVQWLKHIKAHTPVLSAAQCLRIISEKDNVRQTMIYQDSYSKNIEKLNKTSKETYAYFQEEKQKLEAIEKNIKSNESLITKALSTQKRSPSESVNISSLKHKKNQLYKEYEEKCILLRELQKLYERLSKVDPITEVFNLAGLTLTSTKECEQSPSSGKFFATFIKEMKPKETAEYSFIFLDKSTQKVCSHATAFYIGEDKHIRFFDTNRGEYRVPHEQFEKFIGGYIEKHYATPSKHIIRFVANKMPAAITTHPPTKLATPMTANAQKTPKEVKVTH